MSKSPTISGRILSTACVCLLPLPALASVPNAVERLLATEPLLQSTFIAGVSEPTLAESVILHTIQSDEFGDEEDRDKVNVTRAVGLSILLPGAGHWAMGSRGRAGVFFGTEVVAWTAFGYFKTVQHQKEDDFELYARTHAGIEPTGKNDEFYRTLTFYMSREQYNDEGRLIDPSRPYYPDDPLWDWQWESDAAMARYRNIRNQSNEAENRAKLSLGAAVLNRLVAAADAWRTARAINRDARMETASWKVRLKGKPSRSNPGFMVYLTKKIL
jgi:hypothetical protein